MKAILRGILAAVVALGICQAAVAAGAAAAATDSKKLESTPQVKAYRAQLAAMKAGDYEAYKNRGVVFVREPKEESYGTVAVFQDLYGNLWDLLELKQ